jgi:hypothetical protein
MKANLRIAFGTLAVAATAACADADASRPTSIETDALVASAPAWLPSDLTADLPVDEATRAQIEAGLGAMHESMLDVHARYQAALALEGDERAAALDALDADVRTLHGEHQALWATLDDSVSEALAERIHARMAHDDDDTMRSLHERMRRLFGGAHGAGH